MTAARFRRPPDVAAVDHDVGAPDGSIPRVFLGRLPGGPLITLTHHAALIWREACSESSEDVADRLADELELQADDVRRDVDAFLTELVDQGFLLVTPGRGGDPAGRTDDDPGGTDPASC